MSLSLVRDLLGHLASTSSSPPCWPAFSGPSDLVYDCLHASGLITDLHHAPDEQISEHLIADVMLCDGDELPNRATHRSAHICRYQSGWHDRCGLGWHDRNAPNVFKKSLLVVGEKV